MSVKERLYLNEDKYQGNKKKLTKIAKVIMLVGVIIGLILIATGIIRNISIDAKVKKEQEQQQIVREQQQQELEQQQQELEQQREELEQQRAELQLRLEELETEQSESMDEERKQLENRLGELRARLPELQRQMTDEFKAAMGFSDRFYELQAEFTRTAEEIAALESKLASMGQEDTDEMADIRADLAQIEIDIAKIDADLLILDSKSSYPETHSDDIFDIGMNAFSDFSAEYEKAKSTPLFMIAAYIMILSLIIGGAILLVAHGRDIFAFNAQATIPVAKEGMDEMAPAVGQMMGTVAKEVKKSLYENEDTYRDIATKTADIESEAIRRNAQAVQEGFASAATGSKKVCPRCNSAIEGDSIFCEACGRLIDTGGEA